MVNTMVSHDVSTVGDQDLHYFAEGTHARAYRALGSHPARSGDRDGTCFALWAPNAERVSVMGDFNGWNKESHPLQRRGDSGVFEGFLPGVGVGAHYKYHIVSRVNGYTVDKADPFAFMQETPPETGSIVSDISHEWGDAEWMRTRGARSAVGGPMSIYEVHFGSWRRVLEDGNRSLSYREAAVQLVDYVESMGFTHVEFLPLAEHPFFGSWGYQVTGYFAPSSRYGSPTEFMFLIDAFHQRRIGVIMDWVPSHFPDDAHGLAFFDGTHLFEHEDKRQGFHPDWNSLIYNYGRHEIRSFLLSSANFWLDVCHVDALRVDAVASMLYLDYSRSEGQWIPNVHGGRENLQAISFLKELNSAMYREHPDIQMIAEESTSWPGVTRSADNDGLGFGYKWDMGWMHDSLKYMAFDPIYRKHHHSLVTFRMMYAYSENFVMSLSHDEVVHGKGSLFGKMPGDDWNRLANLRVLFSYMYALPGKKLMFMGCEFGQRREWNHDAGLDWNLIEENPAHAGVQKFVADLNRLYRDQPALSRLDGDGQGFRWIDCNDADRSILTLVRLGNADDPALVVALNFTPEPRTNYRVGVPHPGTWREVLNSDAAEYGGAGWGNMGSVESSPVSANGYRNSLNLTLPPLGATFLVGERGQERESATPAQRPAPANAKPTRGKRK